MAVPGKKQWAPGSLGETGAQTFLDSIDGVESASQDDAFRVPAEAVALLGDVADARPGEVIGQRAGLVVRQHGQHLHPALGRHLRIGIIREFG